MPGREVNHTEEMWRLLTDELAQRVAEHLAPRIAELISERSPDSSPWLTTSQAVAYSGLAESTFRKLAACGKIPSHGGKAKLFYRPEIDQALLGSRGPAEEARELRRVG
jgi:hypothetical protein